MSKFGVQVNVLNRDTGEREWKWLRPHNGTRYEFVSGEQAHQCKEMCYPEAPIDIVRVAEITDERS